MTTPDEIVVKITGQESGLDAAASKLERTARQVTKLHEAVAAMLKERDTRGNTMLDKVTLSERDARRLRDSAGAIKTLAGANSSLAKSAREVQAVGPQAIRESISAYSKQMHQMRQIQPLTEAMAKRQLESARAIREAAAAAREMAAADKIAAEAKSRLIEAQAKSNAMAAKSALDAQTARTREAARAEHVAIAAARETRMQEAHALRMSEAQAKAARQAITDEEAKGRALERSRFAAQDLYYTYSRVLMVTGAIGAASVAAFGSQERAMADVRRTSQGTSAEIARLEEQYHKLSTDLSVRFVDLAEIGKLGSQMNIPTQELGDFSEAVASFIKLTGEPVEQTASNFGRLAQMIGGLETSEAASGYMQLASQVAELGARSIATEGEILRMAVSVSTTTRDIGLAQHATLGLSSTLASLAVPKEWARGSLQRLFGGINKAVAENGASLEAYAAQLNMTTDGFKQLWRDDPNALFMQLAQSIGQLSDKTERYAAADALGIKATRDVQLLSRLSLNMGLWTDQLRIAYEAQQDVTFLQENLAILTDTLVERAKAFAIAWENAAASMGSSFGAPLKVLLGVGQWIAELIKAMPPLARSFIGNAASIGMMIVGYKAAMAAGIAFAGSLRNVRRQMHELTGSSRLSARTVVAALKAAATESHATAGAYNQLKVSADGLSSAQMRVAASSNSAASGIKASGNAAAGSALSGGRAMGALSKGTGLVKRGLTGLIGLMGGPWGAAWAIGGTLAVSSLTTLIDRLGETRKTTAEVVAELSEAMGGSANVLAAIRKDSLAASSGITGSANKALIEVKALGEGFNNSAPKMYYWLDAAGNVVTATEEMAKAMSLTALSIGESTGKIVFDALVSMQSIKDLTTETKQQLSAAGYDLGTAVQKMLQGEDAYDAYLAEVTSKMRQTMTQEADRYKSAVNETSEKMYSTLSPMAKGAGNLASEVSSFGEGVTQSAYQAALDFLKQSGDIQTKVKDTLESTLADVNFQGADAFNDLASGADEAEEAVSRLKDSITQLFDQMFGAEEAARATQDALAKVYDGLAEYGNVLDPNSPGGLENLSNIQDYFEALALEAQRGIEELGLTGVDAQAYMADQLNQALDFLAEAGFDITPFVDARNQILALLGAPIAMGGVDYSALDSTLAQAENTAVARANNIASILNSVMIATNKVGSRGFFGKRGFVPSPRLNTAGWQRSQERAATRGGGGGGGGRSGGGGRGSRQEVKTAEEIFDDFIKRLKSALSEAVDKWWGATVAQDNYHKSLNSLRRSIESTRKKIADLRQENERLSTSMMEDEQKLRDARMFHAIAKKYGDVDRIAATGTDIAVAEAGIAEKRAKIDANEKEARTLEQSMFALTGYSEAAIANREALRGLQQQMVGLIEQYARSGASTEQVRAYTAKLKEEFITQATQLGFNRGEVSKLSGAFDALQTATGKVPREIRVNVSDGGSIGRIQGALSGLGRSAPKPVVSPVINYNALDHMQWALNDKMKRGMLDALDSFEREYNKRISRWGTKIGVRNQGGPITGFARGGRVPGVSPSDPRLDNVLARTPGGTMYALRSGEYVIQQPAVNHYGMDVMHAINNMRMPLAPTVIVSAPAQASQDYVTLNPVQLNQLIRAVQQTVMLDGQAVSKSVSARYAAAGARGVY